MSPLRLNGSTSGYTEIAAPAIAGDQTFTLPSTGGTLDRTNRAGNILQVVNATYSTNVTSSTSTFVDTGLTASITPSSSSNKILITVFQVGLTASYNNYGGLRLLRGATSILSLESEFAYIFSSGQWNNIGASGCNYLDSPNTTSSLTYKTQFCSSGNGSSVEVQRFGASTITLMEVAA